MQSDTSQHNPAGRGLKYINENNEGLSFTVFLFFCK
jgi:hypothetical protein